MLDQYITCIAAICVKLAIIAFAAITAERYCTTARADLCDLEVVVTTWRDCNSACCINDE